MTTDTLPEGYWIERSEMGTYTDWHVFQPGNDEGSPACTVTHYRIAGNRKTARFEVYDDWGELDANGLRTLAVALNFAADEAEGKLRDD